jgi:hypothetical protein
MSKDIYKTKEFWDKAPEDTQASQSRVKIDVARLQRALASGDHELPNGLSIEQMREWIANDPTWKNEYYFKRPEKFEEGVPYYIPSIGEECLFKAHPNGELFEWCKVRIIAKDEDTWVYRHLESGHVGFILEGDCEFKPIPVEPALQEKMLDKWQRQGLDYAYDDMRSTAALKHVFNFIEQNYKLEEK